jgi:SM-20-related protein
VNIQLQNQFDTIADGLADKGYAIIDQFLSAEEVHQILQLDDFKNALLQFKKAGIGKSADKQINEGIRGDYIQWIDKESAAREIKIYLNRLQELVSFINRSLFLSLKDFEVHKTVYPIGTFYKRHLDQFKKDDHRKLSVICYLNEDWLEEQGGQLRMYFPEGEMDIFPKAGKLVCFRSDQIEHEVLPATRERASLTGWMLDQLNELKIL